MAESTILMVISVLGRSDAQTDGTGTDIDTLCHFVYGSDSFSVTFSYSSGSKVNVSYKRDNKYLVALSIFFNSLSFSLVCTRVKSFDVTPQSLLFV